MNASQIRSRPAKCPPEPAGPAAPVPGLSVAARAQSAELQSLLSGDQPGVAEAGQVQCTGAGPAGVAAQVKRAAALGVRDASAPLPHLDTLQRAFGPAHDLASVRAVVGGEGQASCDAIGATAYATGDRVAFGAAPDLHTAAHEAAHVVQQRQGITLPGGVGERNDSHEQRADAVADRVVQGKSAADLLGPPSQSAADSSPAAGRDLEQLPLAERLATMLGGAAAADASAAIQFALKDDLQVLLRQPEVPPLGEFLQTIHDAPRDERHSAFADRGLCALIDTRYPGEGARQARLALSADYNSVNRDAFNGAIAQVGGGAWKKGKDDSLTVWDIAEDLIEIDGKAWHWEFHVTACNAGPNVTKFHFTVRGKPWEEDNATDVEAWAWFLIIGQNAQAEIGPRSNEGADAPQVFDPGNARIPQTIRDQIAQIDTYAAAIIAAAAGFC